MTPGQALNIGPNPGQNHFNIGVGLSSGHVDYPQSAIAKGDTIPGLSLTDDGWARFTCFVNGKTTSANTKYPRAELRELELDGVTRASWDGRKGEHRFRGVSRVMKLPKLKPWCVVAQIHDGKSDLIRLQTEAVSGRLALVARSTPPNSDTEKRTTVRSSYSIESPIEWEFEVINGFGRLFLGDEEVEQFPAAVSGCYFKCGAYLQSNLDIEKDPTQQGVVDIAPGYLNHWHTGWDAPAPVPVPESVTRQEFEALTARVTALEGVVRSVPAPTPGTVLYTVRSGDTVSALAKAANTTVGAVVALNPGLDPSKIRVGQVLRLS